jgi:hypothetical protein
MPNKTFCLDQKTVDQLRKQSFIEKKSQSLIVRNALEMYFEQDNATAIYETPNKIIIKKRLDKWVKILYTLYTR